MPSLSLTLKVPPSVNSLYVKTRGGGVALTEHAKTYREHVREVTRRAMVKLAKFPKDDQSILYGIDFTFYLNGLENPKWFERFNKTSYYQKDRVNKKTGKVLNKAGEIKNKKGERKAKNRYKKVDVDNRLKFIQDSVVSSIGIVDDAQIFEGSQRKIQTSGEESAVVTVYVVDHDDYIGGEDAEDSG